MTCLVPLVISNPQDIEGRNHAVLCGGPWHSPKERFLNSFYKATWVFKLKLDKNKIKEKKKSQACVNAS